MRINLNTMILDSHTYLSYLFENNHIKHKNYEKFMQNNYDKYNTELLDLSDQYNINIAPYLYTLDCIDERSKKAFSVFLNTYMKRVGLIETTEEDILKMAANSIDYLAMLIITMQYYFL